MKAMLARKKMEEEMEKNTLVDITYCVTDDDRALWDIFEERTVLLDEELGGYGDNDIRSNNDEQEIVLQTYTVDIAAVAENRRCPMLKEQMMVQFVCENCNKVARDVDPPRSQCSRCWVVVAYCSLECQVSHCRHCCHCRHCHTTIHQYDCTCSYCTRIISV